MFNSLRFTIRKSIEDFITVVGQITRIFVIIATVILGVMTLPMLFTCPVGIAGFFFLLFIVFGGGWILFLIAIPILGFFGLILLIGTSNLFIIFGVLLGIFILISPILIFAYWENIKLNTQEYSFKKWITAYTPPDYSKVDPDSLKILEFCKSFFILAIVCFIGVVVRNLIVYGSIVSPYLG